MNGSEAMEMHGARGGRMWWRVRRVYKILLGLTVMLAVGRYAPIYYNSWQFQDFVREQTQRIQSKRSFKQNLVNQAKAYSLPISESDIDIRMTGSVMRVSVDYQVPLNLLVYQPKLQFHVIGSGLVRE